MRVSLQIQTMSNGPAGRSGIAGPRLLGGRRPPRWAAWLCNALLPQQQPRWA
jgi:hypothetical protein